MVSHLLEAPYLVEEVERKLQTKRVKKKRDVSLVKEASLELPARAVCFSSNGQTILVGCGNGAGLLHSPTKNSLSNGYFLLIDTASLQVIHKRRDTSSWIREASFGPNDELFALAAADKKIYIYHNDASQRFKLKCILHSHPRERCTSFRPHHSNRRGALVRFLRAPALTNFLRVPAIEPSRHVAVFERRRGPSRATCAAPPMFPEEAPPTTLT